MVLPVFGAAGTHLAGASAATAAVPVPAGMAAGHIVLVGIYKESTAVVTPPDGTWTELTPVNAATDHSGHLFWKRATGADSGTYSFSWTGAAWRVADAIRISGVFTSGSPFDTGTGLPVGAVDNGSVVNTPNVALTTFGVDRLLAWFATSFSEFAWTPPLNFTERADNSDPTTFATQDWPTAGATGNVFGTTSLGRKTAWLAALLPVPIAPFAPQSLVPRRRAANW